jgi:tetratricopeptide (TPR) repeat protein
MSEKNEKLSFSDTVALFLQKYKIVLFAILAVAVIGLVGILAYTLIEGGINNAAAKGLDGIREKYDAYMALSADDAKKADSEKAIVDAVGALAKKYPSRIAAQEALMMKGDMANRKEDFKGAQESYYQAFAASKKSFIAPFALRNAAASAESAGDLDKAIEYYGIIIKDYKDRMPGISLSYFNLGRLYEAKKDYIKATATFTSMGDLFPIDSWTNLAKSRIIYFKSQGLVP